MAFESFLIDNVTATIGSPLWWTTLLLLVFFGWGDVAKCRGATAICFTCATLGRSKWYLYSSTGSTAMVGCGLMMLGFRGAASLIGRAAMTALT